ncbi:MAG: pyrroloquinoline quinone biosynthesis protein PqqB [Pseudomonadota bacterium]
MGDRLRALVLGSAAGGGLPQWNCGCRNCTDARKVPPEIVPQSQSSLGLSLNGTDWALLNVSPDIRTQILDNPRLHPKSRRDSPIKSVLLTNGDIDHIAGLLVLRERQPFTVFLTADIAGIIEQNPVFSVLDRELVTFCVVDIDQPFELLPGVRAELFSVPGKVALFMEEGEVESDRERGHTVGVRLEAGGERMWYVPGCARLSDDLRKHLQDEALVFFDGTVFENDEMQRVKVGQKTGARMGHMAMNGPDGSIAGFADLNVARKIYVHINNTNPVWQKNSTERRTVEEAGWEIAYDGMEVVL